MLSKTTIILAACLTLAACSSDTPHIIQPSSDSPTVQLVGGQATQIEMPSSRRVQSVAVGNPALVTAERADNVVSLIPKEGAAGETNLIVRAADEDGETKVYQYRVIVQSTH